jgi:glucose-1-phosphate thymidylyltransferase
MQAGQFVQVIEERQGLKVGCIEEIAWGKVSFLNNRKELAEPQKKSGYGEYLWDCWNISCMDFRKSVQFSEFQ